MSKSAKESGRYRREPILAEFMDSVALERRLAEARERRAVALARRAADGAASPSPVKVPHSAAPLLLGYLAAARAWIPVGGAAGLGERRSTFAAGLIAGLAVAGFVGLVSGRAPSAPDVWHQIPGASVAAVAERPAVVDWPAPLGVQRPDPHVLAAAAPAEGLGSLRPEPRPARAGPPPQPARLAPRSARGRPAVAAPPDVVVEIIGDLNLATIGRAAATLGVRERAVLPGVTLSLDRRGLGLKPHKVRNRRGGED